MMLVRCLAPLLILAAAGCVAVVPAPVGRDVIRTEVVSALGDGTISVVAAEGDRLGTYIIRPCDLRTGFCATTLPADAAFADRRFILEPGGAGTLLIDGRAVPLAWE